MSEDDFDRELRRLMHAAQEGIYEEIAQAVNCLFPNAGRTENPPSPKDDQNLMDLILKISDHWEGMPDELKRKIVEVEMNVCKRAPFSLHVVRLDVEGEDDDGKEGDWLNDCEA